jgi:hypothetical protein
MAAFGKRMRYFTRSDAQRALGAEEALRLALLQESASAHCRARLHDIRPRAILHRKCNAKGFTVKTSTIPSLRVTPELRAEAEGVLHPGESLSSFVENAVRLQIYQRLSQKEFIERGLASREMAKASGEYHATEDVLAELDELLSDAAMSARK